MSGGGRCALWARQQKGGGPGTGGGSATLGSHPDLPGSQQPVAGTETGPLGVDDAQADIDTGLVEGPDPYEHRAPLSHPGREPAQVGRTETHRRADHHHIDRADQRRDRRRPRPGGARPRRIDHQQPFECHSCLGGGDESEAGVADHRDPGPRGRRSGDESECQGGCADTVDRHHRATTETTFGEEGPQRRQHREGALARQHQRCDRFEDSGDGLGGDHGASIEHLFAPRKGWSAGTVRRMPFRRVLALLVVIAAACAPAPPIGEADEREPPRTTSPATSAPPATTAPTEPSPIPGRIVTHDTEASIRTDEQVIALETGESPTQPTWSRDGSRVVVMSRRGPLPLIDVFDGTTGEPIAGGFAERPYFFFSWSHDGTRIAALGPGATGTSLDILDADGALVHADVAEADSLFVAWDPEQARLVAHADESLLRVDPDGSVTDLGLVGLDFFAPKWIPGTSDVLLVVDIEGTPALVRRGVDGGDPMTTLGPVQTQTGIAVDPAGRVAAITTSLDAGSEAGARRTGSGGPGRTPAQTVAPGTGTVEIVDLSTGERTLVLEGLALWTEWSPDGSRLLIATLDDSATITWWVHEAAPPGDEAARAVTSFTPAPTFFGSYLAFADQYIEQPRLWSPDGAAFVFAETTPVGSSVRVASAEEDGESFVIGPGEVGFWSPSP